MSTKTHRWWAYKKPHTAAGTRDPGPHGVTVEMIKFSRGEGRRRYFRPGKPEVRDRSLRGKARRLARKAAQRRPLTSSKDW